ncbi:MAG: dgkA [Alphaproteobacteria bacterium]|nr:dgkA [Alphaproteobacteria bacterium]
MLGITTSFRNSYNGLRLAWTEDRSFRNTTCQVVAGVIIATVFTLHYNETIFKWLLLVGSVFPMLIIETVNCSIEAVTDKASPERHPLAKKAKDMGSAAVFLARLFAIICWGVVIKSHFFAAMD